MNEMKETSLKLMKPEKNEITISQDATVMDKLLQAAANGMPIETLEKFMDLAERNQKREAEQAFNTAYAEYKKNIPTVKPDEKGRIKTKSGFVIEWDYVSLGKLSAEIAKAMAPFGLSFDWATEQNGQTITVSCFIRHSFGSFRKVLLSCGPDTSGDKSAIHAIKSTITYLKKATLEMASGVSMSEHDDDGIESGAGYPEQRKQPENTKHEAKAEDRTSIDKWLTWVDAFHNCKDIDIFNSEWKNVAEPAMKSMPKKYQDEMLRAKKEVLITLGEK